MSLSNSGPPSHLLTMREAAAQLGITERTLRRWRRKREIKTYRVAGRKKIMQIDVDALLRPQEEL